MRLALSIVLVMSACGGPQNAPAAEPRRPKPMKVVVANQDAPAEIGDCPVQDPGKGSTPKIYQDRILELGANLADEGLRLLKMAEERARPAPDREAKLLEAVGKFIEALAADPYNVRATYNLAAAYARIGRTQCTLNLLARIVEMNTFPSQKDAIDEVADRLLGRDKWKGKPDPDFEGMRTDDRFLFLAKEL